MKHYLKTGDVVIGNLVDFPVGNNGAELGCGQAVDGTQLEFDVGDGELRTVRWDVSTQPWRLYYED